MRRIEYLDSVRGLAAFAVVVYHFIGWRWAETTNYKIASLVFNGSDAVSLFFVLSGLVLSWKYFHPDESLSITGAHYRSYVLNRIVRLYLPFLAALSIYYLYVHRHDPPRQLVIDFVTNTHHWFEEALLVRGKHDLYIPGWTLEVEMAASLLVPFLALLLRHSRQLFVGFMLAVLFVGSGLIFWGIQHFCMGMLLAYFFRQIESYDMRKSRWYSYRYVLYLAVFLLFSIRHITRIYPIGEVGNYWLGIFRLDLFHFTGAASALILAFLINRPRFQHWLSAKPFLFLGRISYSVYLVHWLFVVYVMDHWDKLTNSLGSPTLAFWSMLVLTIASTLLTATVFNILVERPAIQLGRKISARLVPAATPVLHSS